MATVGNTLSQKILDDNRLCTNIAWCNIIVHNEFDIYFVPVYNKTLEPYMENKSIDNLVTIQQSLDENSMLPDALYFCTFDECIKEFIPSSAQELENYLHSL